MMVNYSPTEMSAQETLCSLRFANQVSQVEMGQAQKHIAVLTTTTATTAGAATGGTGSDAVRSSAVELAPSSSSSAVRAPLRCPTHTTASGASPVTGRASTAPMRAKRTLVPDSGLGTSTAAGTTGINDSDITPPPGALHSSKRARTGSANSSSGGARAALSQTDRALAMSQPRRVNPSRRKWN